MASFLGVLKNVGKIALGIASNPIVESGISMYNPALGAIWKRTAGAIVSIEAVHEQAGKTKSGPDKLSFVLQDFQDGLSITEEILKTQGKLVSYDHGILQEAINAQVAAFNSFTRLKDSIKIQDMP